MDSSKATGTSKQELRKTGIAAIGDVPWGTHFCHFYETKADLLASLVPYYKAGLENNEFCLWVISEPLTAIEATNALREAIPDLERHLAVRSIEIIPHHEWYLDAGIFDFQRVIDRWNAKLGEALSRGYAGIRVHGSGAWLTERDWKNFVEYEGRLEQVIAGKRMVALCTYPLTRTAADVFDVAHVHHFAIARRHGSWETFETPETRQTKAQLTSLRNVMDTIPAMIATAKPEGGLDYVNQRWLDYYKLSMDDVKDWRWKDVVHPEDEPGFSARWLAALSAGTPLEAEFRTRRFDGEYRWLLVRKVPQRGANNKIVKWYIVGYDIEDKKKAVEGLRQSEEQFHNLVEITPAGVWTCDASGRITYYNRRAVELFGCEPSLGMSWPQFCVTLRRLDQAGNPITPDESIVARVLRTGNPVYNEEFIIQRPDHSQIAVLASVAPVRDAQGKITGAIKCFQDITERIATEETLKQAFEKIQALRDQLEKENLALKEEIDRSSVFEEVVGTSAALQGVFARVAQVAPTDTSVLITGETGTGKELIARAIHKRSGRSSRAFVSVNCAAIPQSLIASELFGHEKGAFTGAAQRRLGRFELAQGGTIFLDEVGDLPAETQIALLRVLQEREFERVGGHQTIRADVRVIAATNRDLEAAVAAGTFRSDLFYRLNVFPIAIPPLRQRKADIPLLAEHLAGRYASKVGKKIPHIKRKTLHLLESYSWPGNIRELQNVIERSVIGSDGDSLSVDESWFAQKSSRSQPVDDTLSKRPASQIKKMIEAALAETKGRISGPSGAAAKLGIPPSTLESKIQSLKINKGRFKPSYGTRR